MMTRVEPARFPVARMSALHPKATYRRAVTMSALCQ